jgi:predicted nucleotidyltransferase
MDQQELTSRRTHYQRALADALEDITAALARNPQVKRAILFGSYAHGRADLFTDLDILIVMDSVQDFVSRTAEMYQYLSAPVDMDLLVYTPDELERNRHLGFVQQVLDKGIVIYEKPGG